jgi:hypothetical protein
MRRSFRVLLVLALFALTAGQLMAQNGVEHAANWEVGRWIPAKKHQNSCNSICVKRKGYVACERSSM